MASPPKTQYARSGDVHIAYQVVGEGPVDLVVVAGWLTHVECLWEEPSYVRLMECFGRFSRVIVFDKRGTGLSDRVANDRLPPLEQRMEDLTAVLDAAGVERAAVLAVHEAGPMCALFAATYPARVTSLILYGSHARGSWAPDYPWAPSEEQHAHLLDAIGQRWGDGIGVRNFCPSLADDEGFRQWMARYERLGASPGAAVALAQMFADTDVRPILPTIRVPTLVLHRTGDRIMNVGGGRWMAGAIPGATFVELDGDDHWIGFNPEQIVGEVEEFVTGSRSAVVHERALATLLFTDIVGSTDRLASAGDERWGALLDTHHRTVRSELSRFEGNEIDTAGDGFFASFDGPARAIRCAQSIQRRLAEVGIEVRAGVHTGEVEVFDSKLSGVAVVLAARVMSKAEGGEVLVSRTVVDLVAGSGLRFEARGEFELKGLAGTHQLFAVR